MVENIKGVLEELGYSGIKESAKDLRMLPIYRDSNNPSVLSVKKDNGRWIDYAAGLCGEFPDLVQLTLGLKDVEEANTWLKNKNINVTTIYREKRSKIDNIVYFDKSILNRLEKDYYYWTNRGISPETLNRFCGGLAFVGKMSGRFVFPSFDNKGNIVGFCGRDVFNNSNRVKWKIIGQKDKWVYPAFLNHKLIKESKKVILVEGIGDVLTLFECGFENVLSLFGTSVGTGIINFLIKLDVNKIIISTNNDALVNEKQRGNKAGAEIYYKLSNYFDRTNLQIALPQQNKDWNEILINHGKSETTKQLEVILAR